ncbi:hypothetical protein, partial [Pseudogulbenkiania subflava]|uniref:hypothetical protein n=1 Tax=Pseudogulbenkiania subflava TaxID=451637 RepID=UPI001F3A9109
MAFTLKKPAKLPAFCIFGAEPLGRKRRSGRGSGVGCQKCPSGKLFLFRRLHADFCRAAHFLRFFCKKALTGVGVGAYSSPPQLTTQTKQASQHRSLTDRITDR